MFIATNCYVTVTDYIDTFAFSCYICSSDTGSPR